jgi:site-specific recombinase XerC
MTAQLRLWFEVMINGSTTAPRRRPRDAETAKLHIRALAPVVRIWASQGHDSFAEIERADIVAALPAGGPRRHTVQQGLWSLFRVLKARKAIFVDPTRGVAPTGTNRTLPLPLDAGAIRAALDSPDSAAALAVALVAFHALASRQVRALEVTDIVDGRLNIGNRVIPLAGPVLSRLAAWLDYRTATWPDTTNTHLFINRRTAPRTIEVARPFPWKQVGLAPQTLREDRILDEVRATGGDVRQVCELFGLSVEAAMRYTTAADTSNAAP